MPNRDRTGRDRTGPAGRGAGRGFGLRRAGRGLGAGGYCVCPKCGYKVPHKAGVPCYSLRCPKCDTPMVREQ